MFDMTAAHGNAAVSLTVKDLTISNATVECSGFAAAIVGYNSVNDTVITLENVDVNTANIKAETVAGLVGYSTGKVNLSGCDVSGLILTGEENRPEKVGAYIGTANTVDCVVTTSNCTNSTTYNILHEFVEKIIIHAATDPHSKINRRQEVDIYYKGIGILEMSKVFDSRQK